MERIIASLKHLGDTSTWRDFFSKRLSFKMAVVENITEISVYFLSEIMFPQWSARISYKHKWKQESKVDRLIF